MYLQEGSAFSSHGKHFRRMAVDLWAEDQGEWSQGWGEFGQWPWNRDLREVGHCVSGSRLRKPASRRGPGTAPEILPLPGEAVSAH